MCRRVGTSLEAGIDARKAWSREAERFTGKRRFVLESIVDELGKGSLLSDAIKNTGNAFPQLMRDMVRIGDNTGNNDQVLLRLADHLEHMDSLRSTFLRGLIWPGIQLLFAIPVVAIMIYISEGISEALELDVDLIGLGLQGSHGVTTFFVLVATGIMVAAFLIENWRHGRLGGKQIQGFLYKVPALGKCLETISLGRMAWTLSLTTDTPMSIMRAMKLSLRSTASHVYTDSTDEIVADLKAGKTISHALRSSNKFPNEFLDVIEVGEETGMMSETLGRLSRQYDERAKAAASTLTVIGSFVVWGVIAMLIAVIIIRAVMAYSGMIMDMTSPDYMR